MYDAEQYVRATPVTTSQGTEQHWACFELLKLESPPLLTHFLQQVHSYFNNANATAPNFCNRFK